MLAPEAPGDRGVIQHLTEPGSAVAFTETASGDSLFDIVVAGGRGPAWAEVLDAERLTQMISPLEQDYDFAVVDAAPVLPVTP
jgi:Mrp family chromosome partitioning ATPase